MGSSLDYIICLVFLLHIMVFLESKNLICVSGQKMCTRIQMMADNGFSLSWNLSNVLPIPPTFTVCFSFIVCHYRIMNYNASLQHFPCCEGKNKEEKEDA